MQTITEFLTEAYKDAIDGFTEIIEGTIEILTPKSSLLNYGFTDNHEGEYVYSFYSEDPEYPDLEVCLLSTPIDEDDPLGIVIGQLSLKSELETIQEFFQKMVDDGVIRDTVSND